MKKRNKKQRQKKENTLWILKITLIAFIISLLFSLLSETLLPNVPLIIGSIILILFIVIGIIFDMVGVSVTAASERPLHSMSSRKVKGAKMAIYLKRNASKVSSFCCDVIGDICGIISGSAGVIVATSISKIFHLDALTVSLIITASIASLTIGGKALGKEIAIKNSNEILYMFAKVISLFKKV